MPPLLTITDSGATCAAGGFTIDPLLPVPRAVITHAHGDHARPGSGEYYCAEPCAPLLRKRLGDDAVLVPVPYRQYVRLGDVDVSFHPAGHVLGSAQVRMEHRGEVWVVTGDYKRAPDPTCAPFELVRCDVLVTEATFALPIYRWDPAHVVVDQLIAWWDRNRAAGHASIVLAYALGKCQRLLASLAERLDGDRVVHVHGAVEPITRLYREAGVRMLETRVVDVEAKTKKGAFAGELVLAPPGWEATPWIRRFGADAKVAFAGGHMRVRGTRRRKNIDRGFPLSDHADWPALLRTIDECGAKRVLVTHGFVDPLVRFLREQGKDAAAFRVGWEPEERPGGAAEPA